MTPAIGLGLNLVQGQIAALRQAQGASEAPEQAAKEERELKQVALQFEEIMVRQMLQPLEKSLTNGMGSDKGSPMIGGMIVNSLSRSISEGGGLGLASVIEEALRSVSSEQVSTDVAQDNEPGSG